MTSPTVSASPTGASAAVFGTYELLEQVLSNFSFHDLVRAQQVCGSWKDLIGTSKAIQQQLHLEPVPGAFEPKSMDQLVEGHLNDHEVGVTFAEVVSRINPLLASKEELPRCIRTPKLWVVGQNMPRVLSWAPGQWETMLFTQPPIKKLELKCFAYRGVGCVVKQYMMENP